MEPLEEVEELVPLMEAVGRLDQMRKLGIRLPVMVTMEERPMFRTDDGRSLVEVAERYIASFPTPFMRVYWTAKTLERVAEITKETLARATERGDLETAILCDDLLDECRQAYRENRQRTA